MSGRAVDGDQLPGGEEHTAVGATDVAVADGDLLGAHDGGDVPAPRHHGGVARQAPAAGEQPGRDRHAVHVLGARLRPHQDHVAVAVGGGVGAEHHPAAHPSRRRAEPDGGGRRGGGARRGEPAPSLRHRVGAGPLPKLPGYPGDRLRAAQHDVGVGHHRDRGAHRGGRAPLPDAGLQDPQAPVLDGELHVADVAVVHLETAEVASQLGIHLRHQAGERIELQGAHRPGDDVLALGAGQVVAVQPGVSRRRVAGEHHAGPGVAPAIAEHHRLDVDRGAEVVVDALVRPVGACTGAVPAPEHRLDRTPELGVGVGRDRAPGGGEGGLDAPHLGLRPAGIAGLVGAVLWEKPGRHAEHGAGVHREEAPVAVPGEPAIAGGGGEPLDRHVVETQVEDGVEHPRHRARRAAAHREQERIAGVTEAASDPLLERPAVPRQLGVEALWPAAAAVVAARRHRDGEPGRDRQPQRGRHLRQARALASEETGELARRDAVGVVEGQDHLSARPLRCALDRGCT